MRQRSVTQSTTMAETVDEMLKNPDLHYGFGLYKLVLVSMGTWPWSCQRIRNILLTIFVTITQITMIGFIVGESIYTSIPINPQLMSYMSCNILNIIKTISIRLNWTKIRDIYETLISAWRYETNPETLEIMKRYTDLGKTLCIWPTAATYSVCVPAIIGALPMFHPVVNDTFNGTITLRLMPLQTTYLFAKAPYWLYVIIFLYQCIQLFYTVTGNVGNDGCFFGMAINLTAQLEALAYDIENMSYDENDTSRKSNYAFYIQKQVKLIRMAEYLATTFTFVALAIVCNNCSQVCFYGITVIKSTRTGDIALIGNAIICMAILLVQIFLYCYAGDRLSESIENLGIAAYKSSWCGMTSDNRKDLIFIVMRTHKIFTFEAGNIYRMDLDSFKSIVKAIGSYFSVMKAMFNE